MTIDTNKAREHAAMLKRDWGVHADIAALLLQLADAHDRDAKDAARWQHVEALMVHQRCGPNLGWTIDILLPGDSPTDAIDAAMGADNG